MMEAPVQRPPSATSPWVCTVGFIVMSVILMIVLTDSAMPASWRAFLATSVTALSMCLVEILVFKAHRRDSTGLDWSKSDYNIPRIATKLIGLGTIFLILGTLYYVFPLYRTSSYAPFLYMLQVLAPYIVVAGVAYVIALDGLMKEPRDAYYALGQVVTGKQRKANLALLAPLARSWVIKGFFIPAMFSFLAMNMGSIPANMAKEGWYLDRDTLFIVSLNTIYTVDLIFALLGYIFALRLIDTHERSSDPSMTAWVATLICYPPFWSMAEDYFIQYKGPAKWYEIMADPEALLIAWAIIILILIAIYTWSTIAFGCRFSNLTHRGIITGGPYRFTKHPAYISKNLSWWMMGLPFLAFQDPFDCFRHTVMLLMLNAIYFIRAWTEERHLANDPVYRDYQAYIARHGLFRRINVLPADKIGRTQLNPAIVIK